MTHDSPFSRIDPALLSSFFPSFSSKLLLKVSELPDAVVADVDDDHVVPAARSALLVAGPHHSQSGRPLHLAAVRVYRRVELARLVPAEQIGFIRHSSCN